jgi:hypothetical protein
MSRAHCGGLELVDDAARRAAEADDGVTGGALAIPGQLRCAPIEISEDADGFSIATGAVLDLEPAGPDGGSPFGPLDCPANNVATGATMDYGQWIFSLRLSCRPFLLAFD